MALILVAQDTVNGMEIEIRIIQIYEEAFKNTHRYHRFLLIVKSMKIISSNADLNLLLGTDICFGHGRSNYHPRDLDLHRTLFWTIIRTPDIKTIETNLRALCIS